MLQLIYSRYVATPRIYTDIEGVSHNIFELVFSEKQVFTGTFTVNNLEAIAASWLDDHYGEVEFVEIAVDNKETVRVVNNLKKMLKDFRSLGVKIKIIRKAKTF